MKILSDEELAVAEPRKQTGERPTLYIGDGLGGFTPVGEVVELGFSSAKPARITCVPTPCSGGWHYCPDWFGLTEFG